MLGLPATHNRVKQTHTKGLLCLCSVECLELVSQFVCSWKTTATATFCPILWCTKCHFHHTLVASFLWWTWFPVCSKVSENSQLHKEISFSAGCCDPDVQPSSCREEGRQSLNRSGSSVHASAADVNVHSVWKSLYSRAFLSAPAQFLYHWVSWTAGRFTLTWSTHSLFISTPPSCCSDSGAC